MQIVVVESKEIVAERFNELLGKLDLNVNQFAQSIGLERANTIYNISSARSYPNFEILQLISKNYKQLNLNWLLNGEGEIFISEKNAPQNAPSNAPLKPDFNTNLTSYSNENKNVIDFLISQLKEKDEQMRTKDAQIEAKDLQINNLIETLQQQKASSYPLSNAEETAVREKVV